VLAQDAWTLLSYVAAATRSVRLSANVLNLPQRQPAVLARSAASLDLLSGGRVELGLGAGAFWGAIEAMGGRRLSPAEAVRALAEAIQVMRGIWQPEQPGVLRVDGDFYRVNGAKRGPAPAHEIGIWLGAYRPRMLALVGRAADGWLPSLGYVKPEELGPGNAVIDQAAAAAGRPPGSIRRLLNVSGQIAARSAGFLHGPVGQWAEELAGLALADGISAFILGSDDPAALEIFGQEIAPAVRDLVDTERRRQAAPDDQGPAGGSPAVRAAAAPAPAAPGPGGSRVPEALGLTPTPDTGERLTQPRLWDEATRPAAPPAPAGAVYTRLGRAVGAHLIEVHDHLRAELERVRDLVGQVRAGAIPAARARSAINEMTMRQNDWTLGAYCASYCRIVAGHHTLEDEGIFPYLRSAEPGLAPVIDRLADEHMVIHQVLDDVDQALVGLLRDPDDFSGVQHAVDVLTDTLRSHLAYEETQLVEPLARHGFYSGQL
jgi:hypothetical protein